MRGFQVGFGVFLVLSTFFVQVPIRRLALAISGVKHFLK